jgi:hypothetical protein
MVFLAMRPMVPAPKISTFSCSWFVLMDSRYNNLIRNLLPNTKESEMMNSMTRMELGNK